jgi:hypothetical protein
VLIALGVLDNSLREIGLEGCGVVTAIGSGVEDLAVGDRVIYMSSGCFATEIILPSVLCVKIDDSLTFEQGAALPCVYATATMALTDKANLQKGQVGITLKIPAVINKFNRRIRLLKLTLFTIYSLFSFTQHAVVWALLPFK